jgi:hypothetical protein
MGPFNPLWSRFRFNALALTGAQNADVTRLVQLDIHPDCCWEVLDVASTF